MSVELNIYERWAAIERRYVCDLEKEERVKYIDKYKFNIAELSHQEQFSLFLTWFESDKWYKKKCYHPYIDRANFYYYCDTCKAEIREKHNS